MEPEDAAAGVQDVESLLPGDLAELGAALAGKAQRGGVWRSNDDFAKELQQRLHITGTRRWARPVQQVHYSHLPSALGGFTYR